MLEYNCVHQNHKSCTDVFGMLGKVHIKKLLSHVLGMSFHYITFYFAAVLLQHRCCRKFVLLLCFLLSLVIQEYQEICSL